MVLSCSCYFRFRYDDETDQVMSYQRILLTDLDKIEIGSFFSVFVEYVIFHSHPHWLEEDSVHFEFNVFSGSVGT